MSIPHHQYGTPIHVRSGKDCPDHMRKSFSKQSANLNLCVPKCHKPDRYVWQRQACVSQVAPSMKQNWNEDVDGYTLAPGTERCPPGSRRRKGTDFCIEQGSRPNKRRRKVGSNRGSKSKTKSPRNESKGTANTSPKTASNKFKKNKKRARSSTKNGETTSQDGGDEQPSIKRNQGIINEGNQEVRKRPAAEANEQSPSHNKRAEVASSSSSSSKNGAEKGQSRRITLTQAMTTTTTTTTSASNKPVQLQTRTQIEYLIKPRPLLQEDSGERRYFYQKHDGSERCLPGFGASDDNNYCVDCMCGR